MGGKGLGSELDRVPRLVAFGEGDVDFSGLDLE